VPAKVKIILVKVNMILTFAGIIIHFGGRQSFQDFYLPGLRVVLVGRYFTIGALLSDRSGLAMIRAAP
jgi:hypothetical protein